MFDRMQWLIDMVLSKVHGVPSGSIFLWSGAVVDIPEGWVLCDGSNGTPFLTNRFIMGAGDMYAVNERGGYNVHAHNFTTPNHYHGLASGVDLGGSGGNANSTNPPIGTVTGTTDNGSNIPKFHALCWIMKT